MIRADRRGLLRLAGAALGASLLLPGGARGQAPSRFAPPAEAMRYTRRLERALADGASLVVSRSFAVRFEREGEGFRVDGEQLAVVVEAPAQIESLARLERERIETGVFPLQLDADGAIRSLAPAAANAQLDAAVRDVSERIEQGDHAPAERTGLRAFVDAVHRNAGALLTELPRDLFAPLDLAREETRALALPGGGTGQVRVIFTAARDPATGLMTEARREVRTEVAGDVRRTVESWRLVPLG